MKFFFATKRKLAANRRQRISRKTSETRVARARKRENNVWSFPLSVSTARKIIVPLTITMVLENFKDETCLLHDLER